MSIFKSVAAGDKLEDCIVGSAGKFDAANPPEIGLVYVNNTGGPITTTYPSSQLWNDGDRKTWNGSSFVDVSSGGGGGSGVDKQTFTSNGTWNKPLNAKEVVFRIWGAGGGGGSGRRGLSTTHRSGGAGGSGGAYMEMKYSASLLPSTLPVVIGTGGNGGAARTVDSQNGNAGSPGGNTYIGSESGICYARVPGGIGGGGGAANASANAIAASGGAYYTGSPTFFTPGPEIHAGGTGADARTSVAGSNSSGDTNMLGGIGGASGGGMSNVNAVFNGGNGNVPKGNVVSLIYVNESLSTNAGVTNGGAGGNGADSVLKFGYGGGGGASHATAAGGAGGNGGYPGGGGGGGAASVNGFDSGAGGNGGNGYVEIITYF